MRKPYHTRPRYSFTLGDNLGIQRLPYNENRVAVSIIQTTTSAAFRFGEPVTSNIDGMRTFGNNPTVFDIERHGSGIQLPIVAFVSVGVNLFITEFVAEKGDIDVNKIRRTRPNFKRSIGTAALDRTFPNNDKRVALVVSPTGTSAVFQFGGEPTGITDGFRGGPNVSTQFDIETHGDGITLPINTFCNAGTDIFYYEFVEA